MVDLLPHLPASQETAGVEDVQRVHCDRDHTGIEDVWSVRDLAVGIQISQIAGNVLNRT